MEVDEEWEEFLLDNNTINNNKNINNIENNVENNVENNIENNIENKLLDDIPKVSKLYISTKTKIIYLNNYIDIYNTFWKIPIIDYDLQNEGIIKKQIKISCDNKEKFEELENNLKKIKNIKCNVLKHIDNPSGRIIFKDIRKITIGLSKKDILYNKVKDKSAFYNCFVIALRLKINNYYKEYHVKIFNTGKLEIPGLQEDIKLDYIIDKVTNLLNEINNTNIKSTNTIENVLINSNFNCGYYINREKLFNILRYNYNINTSYDPCSYPGIQCLYYEGNTKVSYMIFRTGSILIVGKCDEIILNNVYNFIKNILLNEYKIISIGNIDQLNNNKIKNKKNIKTKKKYITIQN